MGHVAAGLWIGRMYRRGSLKEAILWMLLFAGLALVPDLDYIPVALGAPNVGPCGHRGATHSLALPLAGAVASIVFARRFGLRAWPLAVATFVAIASHPLLDAMTTTSRGVPLLWPLSFHRFEAPWRPIPDPPCGLALISREGLRVAMVEAVQFFPLLMIALWPKRLTRLRVEPRPPHTQFQART